MKKKFMTFLCLVTLIVPCAILLVACGEPKVIGFSVYLNGNIVSSENSKIEIDYGDEFSLDDHLLVKANFDNGNQIELKSSEYSIQGLPKEILANESGYKIIISYSNFSPVEVTLVVHRKEISTENLVWDYTSPFTYSGEEKSVHLTNLPSGINVTYEGNTGVDSGVYVAVASLSAADDNFVVSQSTLRLDWKIEKKKIDLSNVAWDYISEYTYTGGTQKVELKNLPEEVEVRYTDNEKTNVGTYTAKAEFEYDKTNYEIVNNNIEDCVWEIVKANPSYELPTNLMGYVGDNLSTVTLPENFTWENKEQVISNGEQTYLATYTPDDTANYNIISNISISVMGEKRSPSYSPLDNLEATYGDKLEDIIFPLDNGGVWSWKDEGTTLVGNVGERHFVAIFTPNDTERYEVIEVQVTINVLPKEVLKPTLSGTYVYTGQEQTANLVNFDEGIMNVTGHLQTNANVEGYEVLVSLKDKENYVWEGNSTDDLRIIWKIERKEIDLSNVAWDYISEYTYTGGIQKAELKNLPEEVEVRYIDNEKINVGTYTAKAEFEYDETNYEIVNNNIGDCVWEIVKADPSYELPTNLTGYVGDNLSTVTLPENFTWENGEQVISNGAQTYLATYTPDDTANYNIISNISISVVGEDLLQNIRIKIGDALSPQEDVTGSMVDNKYSCTVLSLANIVVECKEGVTVEIFKDEVSIGQNQPIFESGQYTIKVSRGQTSKEFILDITVVKELFSFTYNNVTVSMCYGRGLPTGKNIIYDMSSGENCVKGYFGEKLEADDTSITINGSTLYADSLYKDENKSQKIDSLTNCSLELKTDGSGEITGTINAEYTEIYLVLSDSIFKAILIMSEMPKKSYPMTFTFDSTADGAFTEEDNSYNLQLNYGDITDFGDFSALENGQTAIELRVTREMLGMSEHETSATTEITWTKEKLGQYEYRFATTFDGELLGPDGNDNTLEFTLEFNNGISTIYVVAEGVEENYNSYMIPVNFVLVEKI